MRFVFHSRMFGIQLALLALTLFAAAQDVQMVPDQQDREAADKAQSQTKKTRLTSRSPRSKLIPMWSSSSSM